MKLFEESEGTRAIKTTLHTVKQKTVWQYLKAESWGSGDGSAGEDYSAKMRTWVWIPGIHVKSQPWLGRVVTSVLGDRDRQIQRAHWPARLVKNNSEFPVQWEILSQGNRTESDRKTPNILLQPLQAHVWVSMCTHTCMYHIHATHTKIINSIKIKHSAYLISPMHETPGSTTSTKAWNLGMVAHTHNTNTWEMKERELGVQGHPWMPRDIKASLS